MNAEATVFKIKLIYGYNMNAYEIKNTFPHSNFFNFDLPVGSNSLSAL